MPESSIAFVYLLDAIGTAQSNGELTKLEKLAHAHYRGVRLATLSTELAARRMKLELARLDSTT